MIQTSEKTCPKCHSPNVKSWRELNDDEKMLAKSLPTSVDRPFATRKKHRFCTRCWYEEKTKIDAMA